MRERCAFDQQVERVILVATIVASCRAPALALAPAAGGELPPLDAQESWQ